MLRRARAVTVLQLHQKSIALQEHAAAEDAADPGEARGFTRLPKLVANRGGEHGKLLRRVVKYIARDRVSRHCGFIHQRSQRRYARTRPILSVETMQGAVGVCAAGG